MVAGKFVAARCLLLLKASVEVRDEAGRSLVALAALHGQHAGGKLHGAQMKWLRHC